MLTAYPYSNLDNIITEARLKTDGLCGWVVTIPEAADSNRGKIKFNSLFCVNSQFKNNCGVFQSVRYFSNRPCEQPTFRIQTLLKMTLFVFGDQIVK